MPGKHLTPFERGELQAYLSQNMSQDAIAKKLGRDPSTIFREVTRNATKTGYDAQRAQRRYIERRKGCRPQRRLDQQPLRAYVVDNMRDAEWTPEQVAGRLPLDYPHDPTMRISHETIYQAIYSQDSLHFLIALLPQARPRRRNKGQGKTRRGPSIPNRVGIENRPSQIEQRIQTGHWEGDTVVGKGNDGFIVTLVERTSRLFHAVKTQTKKAAEIAQAVIASLLDRPITWVRSITFDNGTEFAYHEQVAHQLGVDIYFADPYAAYQRGTNENTNGLLRRYLPKGKSFKELTQRQLDMIVDQINNRPRKCLGYRTPNEVFQQQRELHLLALSS
ncbi:MAG: IS30 family transposase [Nitrospiraceae bacterium]|nr:IS30 family transposase [Nitrospiraceae bacterium]